MSFGVPVRNGLAIGLGTVAPLATDYAGPNPGPPWTILDSAGAIFTVDAVVLSADGTAYYVVETVLSADGTAYSPI
jgi:hypothetical protein